MTRTLIALVRDHPSALNRTVSLIRRRGYRIERLMVGRAEQPGFSHVSVEVDADNVAHVVEQLRRIIDVINVAEVRNDLVAEWADASNAWGTCSMPGPYHWQADGADDHDTQ